VCVGGDLDVPEDGARAAALLVEDDRRSRGAVRVPDGIGSALGDRREQRLGRARPVDGARPAEAVSGDAAHTNSSRGPSEVRHRRYYPS
jgi:hypothetical protein